MRTARLLLAAILVGIVSWGVTPAQAQNPQAAASAQLDSAVRKAIAEDNIPHAKNLALTVQHWKWIAEAQNKSGSTSTYGSRTYGDTRVEMTNTQACKDAQRSYMLEAGAINPNRASLQQKQYAVGISCGR